MKKQSVPKRQLAALLLLAAGTIASHVSFFLWHSTLYLCICGYYCSKRNCKRKNVIILENRTGM